MIRDEIPAAVIIADAMVDLQHPLNSDAGNMVAADHIIRSLHLAGYSVVLSAPLHHLLDETEKTIAEARAQR